MTWDVPRARPAPSPQRGEGWGEHLCRRSSIFWAVRLPESVLDDEGIGEDDELAGHRDDGDLGGLAVSDKAIEEGFHIGIEAGCRDGGEIQNAPHVGSATPDDADALP